jgi:hypothetical protein
MLHSICEEFEFGVAGWETRVWKREEREREMSEESRADEGEREENGNVVRCDD